ncbi:hypothetical protein, partial [Caballeronia mineralivorans]|uniref:hypothetical protein n=1 Tax=Caballeronia mineralivorans TaxID=2010198 RepID=UPI001F38458A
MNRWYRNDIQVAASRGLLRLHEAEHVFEAGIKSKSRSNVSWNGFLRLNKRHHNLHAGFQW